jgi:hypothetical protein
MISFQRIRLQLRHARSGSANIQLFNMICPGGERSKCSQGAGIHSAILYKYFEGPNGRTRTVVSVLGKYPSWVLYFQYSLSIQDSDKEFGSECINLVG